MSQGRRDRSPSGDRFAAETGGLRRKWKDRLPVALLFPNTYHLGMSNLGLQLVWARLNRHSHLVCERFFLPDRPGDPPLSVESNRPLRDFPILLFSVSFERDFWGVIDLLRRGGIEPVARRRAAEPCAPLVVGGGVATFINPEPLAPFMDLFLLGEFEPVAERFVASLPGLLATGKPLAERLLELAFNLPGCYVPSLYEPRYGADGRLLAMEPAPGLPARVRRNLHPGGPVAGHSQILSPETEFAGLHLVELGRGCSRGCRFCAAGFVYRPPRLWPAPAITAAVEARPPDCRRVGLLGMEMARPEELDRVSEFLLAAGCSLSFSSLRADAVHGPLLELLAQSEVKTAVIAPDGGSERLRRVINKGLTRDDCLRAAINLAKSGIHTLKLYFMIGLPTETDDDLTEMIGLIRELQMAVVEVGRPRGRVCRLALSVNCFVPKAWTPFQFAPFCPVDQLKAKIKFLRAGLADCHHLQLSFDRPDEAFFQATLARGDRRVGMALLELSETGGNWRQAFRRAGVVPEDYALRGREEREPLPWEVVDHGLSRDYLWREYQLALRAKPSRPCEIGETPNCRRCGVCHD